MLKSGKSSHILGPKWEGQTHFRFTSDKNGQAMVHAAQKHDIHNTVL